MKGWVQFLLYLIAQALIFRLIAVEYSKYKLREYKTSGTHGKECVVESEWMTRTQTNEREFHKYDSIIKEAKRLIENSAVGK